MNTLSSLNNQVLFTNWTNEDFICKWGGNEYLFKAKSSEWISAGSHEHNLGLAKHFTKHLVDREMNRRNVPTDHFTREQYEKQCYVSIEGITSIPVHKVSIHTDTGLVAKVEEIGREDLKTGEIIEKTETVVVPNAVVDVTPKEIIEKTKRGRPAKVKEVEETNPEFEA